MEKISYTFTRADVDRLVKAMLAKRDALDAIESEALRDYIKPSAPYEVVLPKQLAHIARVTGARADTIIAADGSKWQIVCYGGAEFRSWIKEVA